MSKKNKSDSDLPDTQPEGVSPEGNEASRVDPDQVETHHLNPGELPAWVLSKLPAFWAPFECSFTVDTSKFQEPHMAYAIRFAMSRGAKEGDIVHLIGGV
jgi:hypothetical protein